MSTHTLPWYSVGYATPPHYARVPSEFYIHLYITTCAESLLAVCGAQNNQKVLFNPRQLKVQGIATVPHVGIKCTL